MRTIFRTSFGTGSDAVQYRVTSGAGRANIAERLPGSTGWRIRRRLTEEEFRERAQELGLFKAESNGRGILVMLNE